MIYISLLTDYGTGDNYLSRVKLEIIKQCKDVNIVELNNHLNSFNINDAAYNCRILFEHYPFITYNIVLYGQFIEHIKELLLIKHKNRYFFFPNNGIASLSFDSDFDEELLFDVSKDRNYLDNINSILKLIFSIKNNQTFSLETSSKEIKTYNKSNPIVQANHIKVPILYIDKKSNIVLNLKKNQFEEIKQDRNFNINLSLLDTEPIRTIHDTIETNREKVIAYFNEYDYITISLPKGELARMLGFTDRYYDYSKEGSIYYPYYNNNMIFIYFDQP